MRAAVQTGFGGPEVVRMQHVPEPEPAAGEVAVRVAACALNGLDVTQRRGPGVLPGFALPHIAGMDVAGTVAAVGAGGGSARPGQRVVVNPVAGCGTCASCRTGEHGYCADIRVIGGNVPGGLAEYVKVPASYLVPVPDDVPLADAAALPTMFSTAWHAMYTVGRVAAGEWVVVQAAASAVSLAAIQLARRAGAGVIAVASTDEKLAAAGSVGAAATVRNDEDVARAVRDRTDGRGADLVLDHVGADTWEASLASLATGGRLVMLGNTSGDRVTLSLSDVYHRGLRLLGFGAVTEDEVDAAVRACLDEGMRSPRATEFGLDDLAGAWAAQESRRTVGKVLVRP